MAKAGLLAAAFVHRAKATVQKNILIIHFILSFNGPSAGIHLGKATVQNSLIFLPILKQLYNELFFFTGALARWFGTYAY